MTDRIRYSQLPDPVLVVGGYGYRNVGDEAILAGLLLRLADRRVTVVSRSPAETSAMHGVDAIGIREVVPALRSHASVLIGGGGLFGRDMGRIGRFLPFYGLFAKALGRRVVISGVDVDPGIERLRRWTVRRLFAAADGVTVRDARSAATLAAWGLEAGTDADHSNSMPTAPASSGKQLLRQAGVQFCGPVVGLCLTAINREMGLEVERAIVEAVERLPDLEFCVIPLSQHPFVTAHNDLVFARRIQQAAPQVRVVENIAHPSTVLASFGSLSAVVSMRYHSLVFAERVGTPIVPIPYAAKCRAWLAERSIASVEPTTDALVAALRGLLPALRIAS